MIHLLSPGGNHTCASSRTLRFQVPIRRSRSPTHKPHPDLESGELDEGEIIGVVLLEASGDGSEVLELVEEALDEVAVAVQEWAEGRNVDAPWHRFDVGPGPTIEQRPTQRVAIVGAIGQQDLPGADAVQHIGGAAAIVGLAFAQLQCDRQAVGINQRVDLGRQPAPRAPQASGLSEVPSGGLRGRKAPLLTLAACWCTRTEELSTICRSPS